MGGGSCYRAKGCKAAHLKFLVKPVLALCIRLHSGSEADEHRKQCLTCLATFYDCIRTTACWLNAKFSRAPVIYQSCFLGTYPSHRNATKGYLGGRPGMPRELGMQHACRGPST